ncbi:hypothetical protein ACFP81_09235 [Deinococcus lacus]|uniref:Ankyrin repeat domain-containing protein n=1 Tax=Deinococcus lacus TaxID=392561 RepID=A0ABW1YCW1_9DEIO
MPLLNLAIDRSALGAGDYDPGLVAALLERGADPNDARYWPPLLHTIDVEGQAYHHHTRAPRMDLLDLLLARGADPAVADARGYTAMGVAAAYKLQAAQHKLALALVDDGPETDRSV